MAPKRKTPEHKNNDNAISNCTSNGTQRRRVISADHVYDKGYGVGRRFSPTDQELTVDFLGKKIEDESVPFREIHDVDIYKSHPQQLAEEFDPAAENNWYFLTPRVRKYPNGQRPNRAVEGHGYWKATGADKAILHENKNVGSKRALVFYEGRAPDGKKSCWIMHEYRTNEPRNIIKNGPEDMSLDKWILCRIYQKIDKSNRTPKVTPKDNPDEDTPPVDHNSYNNNNVSVVANNRVMNNENAMVEHSMEPTNTGLPHRSSEYYIPQPIDDPYIPQPVDGYSMSLHDLYLLNIGLYDKNVVENTNYYRIFDPITDSGVFPEQEFYESNGSLLGFAYDQLEEDPECFPEDFEQRDDHQQQFNDQGSVITCENTDEREENEPHEVNDNIDTVVEGPVFGVGYRFLPTDQELIIHFMKKKVEDEQIHFREIHEVNIYDHSPQQLAAYKPSEVNEWYFFTSRERKYRNGQRPNREVKDHGYWKATGADKTIIYKDKAIGSKKTLVFYAGKPREGTKTCWIMHEYRAEFSGSIERNGTEDMRLDKWILCRVYQKTDNSNKKSEEEMPTNDDACHPNQDISPISQNLQVYDTNTNNNNIVGASNIHVPDDENGIVEYPVETTYMFDEELARKSFGFLEWHE